MSASWHSHASNTSKRNSLHLRSNPRANTTTTNNNLSTQKQDLLKTRTISSTSSHHRSSSASPNPLGELTPKASRYRKKNDIKCY